MLSEFSGAPLMFCDDPGQVTSSDYLDSCAAGSVACFRCFDVPVAAGTDVNLNIGLAASCD